MEKFVELRAPKSFNKLHQRLRNIESSHCFKEEVLQSKCIIAFNLMNLQDIIRYNMYRDIIFNCYFASIVLHKRKLIFMDK